MGDTREWFVEGFREGVNAFPDDLVHQLLDEQAREYGFRAAKLAIAPVVWAKAVGERMDTPQACDFLGVSRQALAKRVGARSLIGLPGRGTTYYPTWQFDFDRRAVRPVVRHIVGTFAEELGRPDPYVIAAWATTPQAEDLGGLSPAEWIQKQGDDGSLIECARRAAGRLSV